MMDDRPISAPMQRSETDQTWVQVIKLFQRHNMPDPPVRLRDDLVVALEWAWYGQALSDPPPFAGAVCDLSDEELLAELRNRRHRFSPDEYMSQDQCDDRAKLGVLRSLIVTMWKMNPTDPALSILHSKCDELDSIYGNPLPARAYAVNTTLPGREDTFETHQSGMPVAAVDVWR